MELVQLDVGDAGALVQPPGIDLVVNSVVGMEGDDV